MFFTANFSGSVSNPSTLHLIVMSLRAPLVYTFSVFVFHDIDILEITCHFFSRIFSILACLMFSHIFRFKLCVFGRNIWDDVWSFLMHHVRGTWCELENHHFCKHHSNHWSRQELSIDTEWANVWRGTDNLYSLKVFSYKYLLITKEEIVALQ